MSFKDFKDAVADTREENKSKIKKRIIPGIAGVLIFAAISVYLFMCQAETLTGRCFGLISAIFAVASIVFIFASYSGFLYVVGWFGGMVALMIGMEVLPEPYNRILAFFAFVILIGGAFFPALKIRKKKDKAEKTDVTEDDEDDEDNEDDDTIDEAGDFAAPLGLGEETLLLSSTYESYYQAIKYQNRKVLLIHKVGGLFKGFDPEKFITKDEKTGKFAYAPTDKDIVIEWNSISKVRYNAKLFVRDSVGLTCGSIKIKYTDSKSGRKKTVEFNQIGEYEPGEVQKFFSGVEYSEKVPDAEEESTANEPLFENERERTPQEEKKLRSRFNICSIILLVLTILADGEFLFFKLIPYEINAVICMVLPAIILVYSVRHEKYVNLLESRNINNTNAKENIDIKILIAMWLSVGILLIRTIMDFNLVYSNLTVIYSLILGATVIFMLLALTKRWRCKNGWGIVVFYVLLAAGIAYSYVIQINYITSAPIEYAQYEVSEKNIDSDDKNATLSIIFSDGREHSMYVDDGDYEKYEIGDSVTVGAQTGGLGIEYFVFVGDLKEE